MGFRFCIEDANTVALLTCGMIEACYDNVFRSHDSYYNFRGFLNHFHNNLYSGDIKSRNEYSCEINAVQNSFAKINNIEKLIPNTQNSGVDATGKMRRNEIALQSLSALSRLLDNYRVKSLLLPQIYHGNHAVENFMRDEGTLINLLNHHPYAKQSGSSYLVLQLTERPSAERLTIFNSFPNFNVALRQTCKWPAVLFWNGKNKDQFAFVPVSSTGELEELFGIVCSERNCFGKLNEYVEQNKEKSHYYIQLSDLHFGNGKLANKRDRLKVLLENEISTMKYDDVGFIVTGDVLDTPTDGTQDADEFNSFLKSNSKKELISVLGNHDVSHYGLKVPFFKNRPKPLKNTDSDYPKIVVDDEIRVLFLLFNSNVTDDIREDWWAKGKIGNEQMAEMGNKLDRLRNEQQLGGYTQVAVLHHHVVKFSRPNFYRQYRKNLRKYVVNENTLRLIDSKLFLDWLNIRGVRIVLHGHNHILGNTEEEGIHVISCGSSTGHIQHEDKRKTFMTYNLLNFSERSLTCVQCAEEVIGGGLNEIKDSDTVTILY